MSVGVIGIWLWTLFDVTGGSDLNFSCKAKWNFTHTQFSITWVFKSVHETENFTRRVNTKFDWR